MSDQPPRVAAARAAPTPEQVEQALQHAERRQYNSDPDSWALTVLADKLRYRHAADAAGARSEEAIALTPEQQRLIDAARVLMAGETDEVWDEFVEAHDDAPPDDVARAIMSLLASAAAQAQEVARLEDEHERALLKVIAERDRREEQVSNIYAALGGENEWSNLHDLGDEAIEMCADLRRDYQQLGEWSVTERERYHADLTALRQQLAEEHGLPGWWPLSNDAMPDREWTNIEHLRNQLWLANDAAAQTEAQLAEAREALTFYADGDTYDQVDLLGNCGLSDDKDADGDFGNRARSALRALGGPT